MTEICSAVDFYARHPISAEIILAKLNDARGNLDNVTPTSCSRTTRITTAGSPSTMSWPSARDQGGSRVADFCAGLGGPHATSRTGTARRDGHRADAARVAGAEQLTRSRRPARQGARAAGRCDAGALPDASMDAVISQEAFLHVPELPRAFAEARRILRPGGRFAFTNWVAEQPLTQADRQLMWDGMAVQRLYSFEEHRKLLEDAGFSVVSGRGPDRRLGDDPGTAVRHVSQAARRGRAGWHAGWPRRLLPLLRAPVELVQSVRLGRRALRGGGALAIALADTATLTLQASAAFARAPVKWHTPARRGGTGANWQAQDAAAAARTFASMSPASGSGRACRRKPPSDGQPDVTLRALQQRIRQQEILSETGRHRVAGYNLRPAPLAHRAVTAEGLRAEFCKVLEYLPERTCFLVRAGVGWGPGVVGQATVGADLASPAGFALRTGKPVISNHLENEERFRTPEILAEHGIYAP
jgi:SAM-dependent methyltransferase